MRAIFHLFLFLLTFSAEAHTPKDGDIYASLGTFVHQTHAFHHDFYTPTSAGFGIIGEGDLDSNGGLEVALIYMNSYFTVLEGERRLVQRGQRMHITLGYRHWFQQYLSAGLGFFSSYSMGDPETIRNDFGLEKPNTSAGDTTEYGFDTSFQVEPWSVGRFAIVADFRYSWSVTAKENEDSNFYGLFLALKYFVQSRQESLPEVLELQ